MHNWILQPEQIEKTSFEIISKELGDYIIDPKNEPIVKRVIHTTADLDYAKSLFFSENAVEEGIKALKSGADIVCDTNMARSGVNKTVLGRLGGSAHCFIADEDVAKEAKERGVTRASICIEKAAKLEKPLIFAIGNAPTALVRLRELIDSGELNPKLVICVPVGFVNVVESKELFLDARCPVIIARGRKGGSNVAAAICNALLYLAGGR